MVTNYKSQPQDCVGEQTRSLGQLSNAKCQMSFQSFEAAVHFNACGFSANLAFVDI